jgi:ABC-type dipeptide/oligopeptide/nickel transport system permease subunit
MNGIVIERPVAPEVEVEPAPAAVSGVNAPLVIGIIGVTVFVVASVGASFIAPYGSLTGDPLNRLKGMSALHLLGTDQLGRDTLSRLLYGGQLSLMVAAVSVAIGLIGGALIGMIAGYRSGWVDALLMRAMDLLFSFPAILLAIIIMAVLGTSVTNAMIAIGIIFIPGFARYARSLTRSVVLEQFVAYARSTGVPFLRILLRDVLPNVAPGLMVQATVAIGYAVTLEATLSFLGLGAAPPAPSWGNMIDGGRGFMGRAPLMVIAPAAAILFTVLVTNLLGEGLQLRNDKRQSRGTL